MELAWREVRRGLWECDDPNGDIVGGAVEISPRRWRGYLNTGVETGEWRSLPAAKGAVGQLVAVGARPAPRPQPEAKRKVWRPVGNEPDPGPRGW